MNLPSPILCRDSLLQGAVDLLALTRPLADLNRNGDASADSGPSASLEATVEMQTEAVTGGTVVAISDSSVVRR